MRGLVSRWFGRGSYRSPPRLLPISSLSAEIEAALAARRAARLAKPAPRTLRFDRARAKVDELRVEMGLEVWF